MKKTSALLRYLGSRLTFYPLFTGVAIASLCSFLTRTLFLMADGQTYAPLSSLSLPVWALILLGSTLVACLPPKPFWPLICWLSWIFFSIPVMAANYYNTWMLTGVLFLAVLLTYMVWKDTKRLFRDNPRWVVSDIPCSQWIFGVIIGFVTFVPAFLLAYLGIYRYLAYYTPCFDFGIFTQMFESMRTTFLPTTTCERYKELSHFAVHLSPIYYVLLPIYCIFPSPVTLALSQALVVASSVIPLVLIARRMEFSRWQTILAAICIAMYPALHGGTFYDLHENCFLTPLLLWFFYFLEKNSHLGMVLTSIGVFLVKEDAPVYIAFIALYLIFSNRKKLFGIGLLVLSVGYFFFALSLLAKYGEGAMNWRYMNLMLPGEDSLIYVVLNIVQNPAHALSVCFSAEKIEFLLQIFLPMAGAALLIKRADRIILLGPLVLITLLSDYVYQHSIYFQYNFGIIAILFYLALLNLKDIAPKFKQFILIVMATASVISYVALCSPYLSVGQAYETNQETIQIYNEAVEKIDGDRSVAASTFLVPHLYDCKELYEVQYTSDTDQILLIISDESGQEFYQYFLRTGSDYKVTWEVDGVIVLLEKETAQE